MSNRHDDSSIGSDCISTKISILLAAAEMALLVAWALFLVFCYFVHTYVILLPAAEAITVILVRQLMVILVLAFISINRNHRAIYGSSSSRASRVGIIAHTTYVIPQMVHLYQTTTLATYSRMRTKNERATSQRLEHLFKTQKKNTFSRKKVTSLPP